MDNEMDGVKDKDKEGDAALVSFSSMDEVGLRKKTTASSGSKEDKRYVWCILENCIMS
jgi:hypothetical protein